VRVFRSLGRTTSPGLGSTRGSRFMWHRPSAGTADRPPARPTPFFVISSSSRLSFQLLECP
jgi:hypothetical protein